jgi:hypothetical protein
MPPSNRDHYDLSERYTRMAFTYTLLDSYYGFLAGVSLNFTFQLNTLYRRLLCSVWK